MKKAYNKILIILVSTTLTTITFAQSNIPPEGYIDSSGKYVMRINKVLANRGLMVRDMGKANVCVEVRPVLEDIKIEMFKREMPELEERGFSKEEYIKFWQIKFKEGEESSVSLDKCIEQLNSWKLMLENIKKYS